MSKKRIIQVLSVFIISASTVMLATPAPVSANPPPCSGENYCSCDFMGPSCHDCHLDYCATDGGWNCSRGCTCTCD